MKRVIFISTLGAGRALMATEFFNRAADPVKALALAASANPFIRVHAEVAAAMREIGIELNTAGPVRLVQPLVLQACLVVTMNGGQRIAAIPADVGAVDWPVADPRGLSIDVVRIIRADIETRVDRLVAREGFGWAPPARQFVSL